MVIIGYDDDAQVVDEKGYTFNKGIFILRNSWSSLAGDQGNFYMSYDYFKLLVHNLNIIKLRQAS